jgi:type II secretory pathway component PulC
MIINKSALINAKWYKVNGVVDGYKIKTINKTNVIISFQKKEYTLSLKSKTNNLIKK